MTMRTDMLEPARGAPSRLPEAGCPVVRFLQNHAACGGGFRGRGESADLYYSVFATEGLLVLGADLPEGLAAWTERQARRDDLDVVHAACAARLAADVPGASLADMDRDHLATRLAVARTSDGGFTHEENGDRGTAYGCFMAAAAYADLGLRLPDPEGVVECLAALAVGDGAYANEADQSVGLTPATAAAATLLEALGRPIDAATAEWLLARQHESGGFVAHPDIPMPDLLSTATALHTVRRLVPDDDLASRAAAAGPFVDSLWDDAGGFRGHWLDDRPDPEYTWYGLVALGHLAEIEPD